MIVCMAAKAPFGFNTTFQAHCPPSPVPFPPNQISSFWTTSALDVSVQSQALNLLRQLQRDKNLTYLFITHNLDVVSYLADEINVMEHGEIVERGTVDEIFDRPEETYTKRLPSAIPSLDPATQDLLARSNT